MGSRRGTLIASAVAATTLLGPGIPPATSAPAWGPIVDLTGPVRAAYASDLAVSADGTVVALWQRGIDERAHLFTSRRRADGGWTAPVRVPGTRGVTDAAADFAGSGALVVVWASGRRVMSVRRTAAGAWGTPTPLARTPGGREGTYPGYLTLDVNRRGRAVVAWETVDDDADAVYARSRVQAVVRQPGGHWGPARTLSTRHDAVRPQAGLDGHGRSTVVWSERIGQTGSRVMTSSRRPGGAWSGPTPLSGRGTDTGVPSLAVIGSGRLAVAWPYGSDALDGLRVRRWSPAGGWARSVRAPAVSQSPAWMDMGLDRAGTVTVVWTPRWRGAVRAVDQQAGGRWSRVTRLAPPGSFFSDLALEVNAGGDAVAGWESLDGSDHPVLGAYRPRGGGSWSPAVAVSARTGDSYGPELGLTRSGAAVALWSHQRSPAGDRGRIQARSLAR